MKAFPLLALLGGAVLLGSQSSKPTSVKKTYKHLDPAAKEANEEAIIKYFSSEPLYVKDVEDIMTVLTDVLKNEIIESGVSVNIPLDRALFLFDGSEIVISEKYKDKKEIANDSKLVDSITKEVLTRFASDVYWKEGLTPYLHGSPFQQVWSSVNRLVEIAAENREQKGI